MLPYLSLSIWVPIAFGVAVLAMADDARPAPARWIALAGSIAGLAVCIPLWTGFQAVAGMQFVESASWIRNSGARPVSRSNAS